jgi:hypothetical protein
LISNIENIIYQSPNPQNVFCYTPSIVSTQTGRLIVSFDLGGDGVKDLAGLKSSRAKGNKFGQGKIFISDDSGQNWSFIQDFPFWHARLFTIGNEIYLIGHAGDICIMKSNDNGETWSDTYFLTEGEKWHSSACNIIFSEKSVYLAMEQRCRLEEIDGWDVAGLSPTLFRANIKDNLCLSMSWDRSEKFIYKEVFENIDFDFFGIPFYDCDSNKPKEIISGINNAPLGWLEANVVQFKDKDHIWCDITGNTLHLFLRSHTAGVNYANLIKITQQKDGKMIPSLEKTPSGKNISYIPFPGGHLKFFILYDELSQLFWLISNQATDSKRNINSLLKIKRYGLPNNERHRLQLHFSKNCIDWCFAEMIACSIDERISRNYPSAVINGKDMHIVCRSADENALNPQYNNLITHHIVGDFRQLIY